MGWFGRSREGRDPEILRMDRRDGDRYPPAPHAEPFERRERRDAYGTCLVLGLLSPFLRVEARARGPAGERSDGEDSGPSAPFPGDDGGQEDGQAE